jgi:tetratricopeptide (TPR) repeat protein
MVLVTLAIAGGVIAIGMGILWAARWLEWAETSQWAVWPPLTLNLPTAFFAHQHEAALMVAMLYPAVWCLAGARLRLLALGLITPFVILVIVLDGSRTVWLAAGTATLILGAVLLNSRRLTFGKRARWLLASLLVAAAAVLLLTPIGLLVYTRITAVLTLFARGDLWSNGIGIWLRHPITGLGPGSIPFGYLLTDFYQTTGWSPRNPDNALVQLLAETGVFGIAAAAAALAAVASAIKGRTPPPVAALWAVAVAAISTIGMNPTDFTYLLVIIVVWSALAAPPAVRLREVPGTETTSKPWKRFFTPLHGLAALSLSVAVLLAGAASVTYDMARAAFIRHDTPASLALLQTATALDPGEAIYARERAGVLLSSGRVDEAIRAYESVLALVPIEPVAHRGLSLALLKEGRALEASAVASAMASKQLYSAKNLAIAAVAADRAGDRDAARTLLADFVSMTPGAAIKPDWPTGIGAQRLTATASEALDRGLQRGNRGDGFNVVLLAATTANIVELKSAMDVVVPQIRGTASALAALATCETSSAWGRINQAYDSENGEAAYWIARAMIAAAARVDAEENLRLAKLFLATPDAPRGDDFLSDVFSDVYRYHRLPFGISNTAGTELAALLRPTPLDGWTSWWKDHCAPDGPHQTMTHPNG